VTNLRVAVSTGGRSEIVLLILDVPLLATIKPNVYLACLTFYSFNNVVRLRSAIFNKLYKNFTNCEHKLNFVADLIQVNDGNCGIALRATSDF